MKLPQDNQLTSDMDPLSLFFFFFWHDAENMLTRVLCPFLAHVHPVSPSANKSLFRHFLSRCDDRCPYPRISLDGGADLLNAKLFPLFFSFLPSERKVKDATHGDHHQIPLVIVPRS